MSKKDSATLDDKDLTSVGEVTPQVPPASSAEGKAPIKRNEKGQFIKGGGQGGRKKGSKNRIVREREALEAALRTYLNKKGNRRRINTAISRLIDIANETPDDKVAVQAIKVLTDKVMAQVKQAEDVGDKEAPKVNIIIENHTEAPAPKVIIDQVNEDD